MSTPHFSSPLLDRVYTELDLVSGTLLEVADSSLIDDSHLWRELGDWLLLANRVNAERIFFLNGDPVLVFSSLPSGSDESKVLECYRRTWSLARPRWLFLAVGDELRIYSLATPPAAPGTGQKPLTPLQIVTRAAEVGELLAGFHRERLESGLAFEGAYMAEQSGRADQQLLRDVQAATRQLVATGLDTDVAHTLIERAILVRYLEDRKIITDEDFEEIAADIPTPPEDPIVPDFGQPSHFVRFLNDKELTYRLFEKLAEHFNGDLFVTSQYERDSVTGNHLRLLMNLLQGRAGAHQEPLFLWAYDFSVIPTSLISTMYELFCRENMGESMSSTYYTPPQLVEFVLADVLDEQTLAAEPTICDPACGSGIFLVEAYRRIVRHEALREGSLPSSDRLRDILLNRISGCDIDDAAVRLAAFSLYIAFLNYQSPQAIRSAGPLPRLIHGVDSGSETGPLVVSDAFCPRKGEPRSDPLEDTSLHEELPWSTRGFDVIVGNPPWTEIRGERSFPEQWASRLGRTIGDRSPSQLFLWRTVDLLADEGVAALLVSAKAMLNARSTSEAFRGQWLQEVKLERVINFSHVRRDFFETAVAPFMMVRFRKATQPANGMVIYETARPVPSGRRGSPALARLDRQIVSQASLQARSYLWKTYSAGSFRDEALVARLQIEDRLRDWTRGGLRAYGFQIGVEGKGGYEPSQTLRGQRSLAAFNSWGPIRDEWFERVPTYVKRVPDERLFQGQRLLVRRGVSTGFGPHARLETEPFAFRHTTYGISLNHLPQWQAKVILGTLLSPLGRYWLYMVSGSWGTWQDEVRSVDLLGLPLRMTSATDTATERIVQAVDQLRDLDAFSSPGRGLSWMALPEMQLLDEGTSDLFELTDPERDLVAGFWAALSRDATREVSLGAKREGIAADLDPNSSVGIVPYLNVFLGVWNRRLRGTGEFTWRLWRNNQAGVVAVVFELLDTDSPAYSGGQGEDWSTALRRIGVQWEASRAQSILRYGIVRAVTDTAIVVVKRDEQHLWSARAAWQDADATAAQLMSVRKA